MATYDWEKTEKQDLIINKKVTIEIRLARLENETTDVIAFQTNSQMQLDPDNDLEAAIIKKGLTPCKKTSIQDNEN